MDKLSSELVPEKLKLEKDITYTLNQNKLIVQIEGKQLINVIIPENYPTDLLAIEYQSVQPGFNWITSLYEYVLDQKPKLGRFLKHVNKLYRKYRDNNNIFCDDEIFDDSMISDFDIKEQKYQRLLQSKLATAKSKLTLVTDQNKSPAIFTGKIPGEIIMRELLNIRKRYKHAHNITVVAQDDNIYCWNIRFSNFSSQKIIDSMKILKEKFGYDYVELEIQFHDKLYPNYPPFIKIIRPRLLDSLMHKITNLKMTQLEYWVPTRNMEYVVDRLYNIINKHAAIDATSELNDITKCPNGAYHNIEAILVKIASLCYIKTDSPDIDDQTYKKIFDSDKDSIKSTTITNNNGNKKHNKVGAGIGYGTDDDKTDWNIKEYVNMQKEKDNQIKGALTTLIENIQNADPKELVEITKIIDSSFIIPFIKSYMVGTTILEINKHAELFKLILTLLQLFVTEDCIYIFNDTEGSKNLYTLLQDLYNEANQILKFNKNVDQESGEADLISMIIFVFEMINPTYTEYLKQIKDVRKKSTETKNESNEVAKNIDPIAQKYVSEMDILKLDVINFIQKGFAYTPSTTVIGPIIKKLAEEYASLNKNLPIHYDSSIFIRVDETNTRCMRVLITGPDKTPYDSGIFIFDVYMDDNYPQGPPKMKFLNTGGKRFNPNLYNEGKVCLSLLGTWQARESETWNKDTSTLQQLLISVQSQILIEHPYFNEPGHERSYGTPSGMQASKDYNNNIRWYTMMHAVNDFLLNPNSYPEFSEVIKKHFTLKKDYMLKVYEQWAKEAYGNVKTCTNETFNNLKQLLEKY